MSGADFEEVERVFCDTSVLLSYILDQDDGEVRRMVTEVDCPLIISEKVSEELETVPERRDDIYMDFIQVILSDDSEVGDQAIEDRDYLHFNDRSTFESLKKELDAEETPERQLTILRERQKLIDRRYGQVREVIEEIVDQNDDFGLILRIGQVVENDDDCQVLADAADWSGNAGCGDFTTLDQADILSNVEEINSAIRDYHDERYQLNILLPEEILEYRNA
jgi:hypothetical protein